MTEKKDYGTLIYNEKTKACDFYVEDVLVAANLLTTELMENGHCYSEEVLRELNGQKVTLAEHLKL